jgi:L-asparaginase II
MTTPPALPVLVEVTRSGVVESSHVGTVVAVRADGSVALGLGGLDRPVFGRSSNKPLQAAGLLRAGWRPGDDDEVALAGASHSGEPMHVALASRVLDGCGLGEDDLGCPPQLPLSEEAAADLLRSGGGPSRLTMNCSGKHAAMLATCVAKGWPTGGYLAVDHPLQVALTAHVEELAGQPVRHVAVDGCGAPQHALTLPGLARAFAALVDAEPGTPERRVADAMRARPDLVGGTGRDVTELMARVPGLLAKDGAEGVYAGAVPGVGAFALKVEDGAGRARPPLVLAALRALGVDVAAVAHLAEGPVLGGGSQVGVVRVSGQVVAALG